MFCVECTCQETGVSVSQHVTRRRQVANYDRLQLQWQQRSYRFYFYSVSSLSFVRKSRTQGFITFFYSVCFLPLVTIEIAAKEATFPSSLQFGGQEKNAVWMNACRDARVTSRKLSISPANNWVERDHFGRISIITTIGKIHKKRFLDLNIVTSWRMNISRWSISFPSFLPPINTFSPFSFWTTNFSPVWSSFFPFFLFQIKSSYESLLELLIIDFDYKGTVLGRKSLPFSYMTLIPLQLIKEWGDNNRGRKKKRKNENGEKYGERKNEMEDCARWICKTWHVFEAFQGSFSEMRRRRKRRRRRRSCF